MAELKVVAPYEPKGDQPKAIEGLIEGVKRGDSRQTLLGVTGSGKTFTMAHTIAGVQRPALVIAPNKTLAAQLSNEFKLFFPDNAVGYFVSYYDYYQPEAYIPQTDTYIEKDSSKNDEIDKLRHAATSALLSRRDCIIVASVSCIYGLGSPEDYFAEMVWLEKGGGFDRQAVMRKLIDIRYQRNDFDLHRGSFRARGDVMEIWPAYDERPVRIDTFGDQVEDITQVDPVTGEVTAELPRLAVYPATHFVTQPAKLEAAIGRIEAELADRLAAFEREGKVLEAERLKMRTSYDLEMLREVGFCTGIENYSRHMAGRAPGEPPDTLIDYFPDDLLCIIDESHVTVPQIRGMYEGDHSRKTVLVEHGFRLPSALDNRPLTWDEFDAKVPQTVFVSATPGDYEIRVSSQVAEQIVRPTGLVDPEVVVRPTKGQIDDLIGEARKVTEAGERVLVTTLTKRMAEDLTEYLVEMGVKVRYLHSDIDTLERIAILSDLRRGVFDVLVGINLLREGLDLPEVSLVTILDADKEGFLRSERALIQTIGRAARNVSGRVIMYADEVTDSMRRAISETNRRRQVQVKHNQEHGITPATIMKAVTDIIQAAQVPLASRRVDDVRKAREHLAAEIADIPKDELARLISILEEEMYQSAEELRFEEAAKLRDQLTELRKELEGEPKLLGRGRRAKK